MRGYYLGKLGGIFLKLSVLMISTLISTNKSL